MTNQKDERALVAGYIKTIFGVATGKIRSAYGLDHAVANSIAAFEIGPQLISDGLLRQPKLNYSDRDDFALLADFACKVDGPEEAMTLAQSLSEADKELLVHNAESFFTDLINDDDVIPMTKAEKKKLFIKMLEGRKTQ
jgi:hypothetical protein